MDCFKTFLHEFKVGDEPDGFYIKELEVLRRTQTWILSLNAHDLRSFPLTRKLANQLIQYPHEIISILDLVANKEYTSLFGDGDLGANKIQVRDLLFKSSPCYVLCRFGHGISEVYIACEHLIQQMWTS
jgi:DNA replicative helicase MCM subunit Mcm2 (Cdc46/Mcm family)